MKITVFVPKSEFTKDQQKRLSTLGEVVYTKDRKTLSLKQAAKITKGSNILAADPDNCGGFEKARLFLGKLLVELPGLKGIALSSTSTEWIDLDCLSTLV